MIRLKSRTECPPGGFMFFEAQTGKHFIGWGFDPLVMEIYNHRAGNPRFNLSLDFDTIRNELDQANAARVLSIPGAEGYVLVDEESPPPKPLAPRFGKNAARVAGGVVALAEWSISGKVVKPELSEARAKICASCVMNKPGDLTDWFTEAGVKLVQAELQIRNKRQLTTSFDDQLNMCDACWCPTKLKVHCPLTIIKKHLKPEVANELAPNCWIRSELQ